MFTTWNQHEPTRAIARKPPRTKDACSTCKRRKVRCDEQRPLCGHCRRLRLDCRWDHGRHVRALSAAHSQDSAIATADHLREDDDERLQEGEEPGITSQVSIVDHAATDLDLNKVFDYASFMWMDQGFDTSMTAVSLQNGVAHPPTGRTEDSATELAELMAWPSPSELPLSETELLDWFARSNAPPILATVETSLRWSTMRSLLSSMASASAMVRHSVLALSSLHQADRGKHNTQHRPYYDKSRNALNEILRPGRLTSENDDAAKVANSLAVLFILTYIDLVTDRSNLAQLNLKDAYDLVKGLEYETMSCAEKRMVSWLRLLDGRAVSAGGDGLFLTDDRINFHAIELASPLDHNGLAVHDEDNVRDALLDALLEPGFSFFHKVQSFMGRISLIDPWHRSRGTVEDETQVMNIASKINKDIVRLYRSRPPLMDLAAEGKLREPHLPAHLAMKVTRTMRTYLANYHASFVHLHRVAYKHLPRTETMEKAITMIKHVARKMCEDQSGEEQSLPVNMLWPLLMWGCEEESSEERIWITTSIREMGNTATNAGITADVLEEVQRRQDKSFQRVDVRSVMQDVFHTSFAIV